MSALFFDLSTAIDGALKIQVHTEENLCPTETSQIYWESLALYIIKISFSIYFSWKLVKTV